MATKQRRRLSIGVVDVADADLPSADQQSWLEGFKFQGVGGRRSSVTHGEFADRGEEQSFTMKRTADFGEEMGSSVAYSCRKGLKPESPNQDDFFALRAPKYAMFGVFDGHGPFGHQIANLSSRMLANHLCQDPAFETNVSEAFGRAFATQQKSIIDAAKAGRLNTNLSGTTGTLTVVRDGRISAAWVGDSRSVVGRGPWGSMSAMDLTSDHKPECPKEKARIERSGGEVRKLPGDVPHRVCARGSNFPGLAMSRALGDSMAASIGVTHDPEVNVHELTEDDQLLIICSDGVWEFLESQDAVDIVRCFKPDDLQAAADKLCEVSWQKWIETEGDVVDDITAILVHLPTLLVTFSQSS